MWPEGQRVQADPHVFTPTRAAWLGSLNQKRHEAGDPFQILTPSQCGPGGQGP